MARVVLKRVTFCPVVDKSSFHFQALFGVTSVHKNVAFPKEISVDFDMDSGGQTFDEIILSAYKALRVELEEISDQLQ